MEAGDFKFQELTPSLTDANKAIQTEYDYEPFGLKAESGQPTANSFKFTGREDGGTGLYYYRARYYHPGLGRFISEDPVGYAGGDINLYAYVFNNPGNLSDPDGECAIIVVPVVVGGVIAGGYLVATPSGRELLINIGSSLVAASGALYDALFDSKTHDEKEPGQNYEEITGRRDKQNKCNEGRSIKDPNSPFEGCKVRPKNPAINKTGKAGQKDAREIEGY